MPHALEVEMAMITRGHFERAIEEDGATRLRARYTVSTPVAGYVSALTLRAGDRVEQGALIGTITPTPLGPLDSRAEAAMHAHIGVLAAAAQHARTRVERAQAALEAATERLTRSERLSTSEPSSLASSDTARKTARLHESVLASAQRDERVTRDALQQAQEALQRYGHAGPARQHQPLEIRSPISGKVLKHLPPGAAIVPVGTPVLEVGDPSDLEVVLELPASEAPLVSPGMLALVRPMHVGHASVHDHGTESGDDVLGRVRLVEPTIFITRSPLGVEEQRVKVVLDIASASKQIITMGDEARVDVRIVVQAEDDVTMVPVSAIYPFGDRSGVFTVESGRAQHRTIDVVARNNVDAWVKNELERESQVIVYPPTKLKSGARVVPQKTVL